MKFKRICCVGVGAVALSLGVVSCKKKSESPDEAPGAGSESVEKASSSAKGAGSLMDDTEKWGILGRLPAESDAVVAFYDLDKRFEALGATRFGKVWEKLFQEQREKEGKAEMDEEGKEFVEAFKALLCAEVVVAFADGSASEWGKWMDFYQLYNELNYAGMLGNLGGLAAGGGQDAWAAFSFDSKAMLAGVETLQMPPVLFSFEFSEEKRAAIDKVVARMMAEEDAPQGVEFEFEGAKFQSYQFTMADLVKKSWPSGEGMKPRQKKAIEQLKASLAAKPLEFCVGTLGEHVLVSMGQDRAALKLVADAKSSVLSLPAWKPVAGHLSQEVMMLSWTEQGFFEALHQDYTLRPILEGVMRGLEKQPEMASLVEVLQPKMAKLHAKEKSLRQTSYSDMVSLGVWDSAKTEVAIDVFGGMKQAWMDEGAPLSFASAMTPETLFALGYQGDAAYMQSVREYFELIMTTIYDATKEMMQQESMQDQAMQFGMVDQMFLPLVVQLYQGLKDVYQAGMGQQHLVMMDMKGSLPAMPNVPEELVGKQVMPRLISVRDVADRAQISGGWEKMQLPIKQAMGAAAMFGAGAMEAPAPQEAAGQGWSSFFYAIPGWDEAVTPAVTLNDQTYAFGSSKGYNEEVLQRLQGEAAANAPKGFLMQVNGEALQQAMELWLSIMKESPEAGEEKKAKEIADFEKVKGWISAFQSMSWTASEENGQARQSVRLDVQDTAP